MRVLGGPRGVDRARPESGRSVSSKYEWLNLPNRITLARLLIAILLFLMLSFKIPVESRAWTLNVALVVFVVCVATDWLDGWLARRYSMITAFGRIADPFVDKVVVCGTCIYLVGIAPDLIKPWFAVALTAREFLVTGLRSFIESSGIPFGARWGGKIKMILQSITIPLVLLYQANFDILAHDAFGKVELYRFTWGMIWLTLLATLLSAWDYISMSIVALRKIRAGGASG